MSTRLAIYHDAMSRYENCVMATPGAPERAHADAGPGKTVQKSIIVSPANILPHFLSDSHLIPRAAAGAQNNSRRHAGVWRQTLTIKPDNSQILDVDNERTRKRAQPT